jgi:hypothetical protein
MPSRKINFSNVFAGQLMGVREVDDQVWQVGFMKYDLGFFDNEQDRVEPGPIRGELASTDARSARQQSCRSIRSNRTKC